MEDTTGMDLARDAVRRGIALLDEHGPQGWRERIDLSALDMNDGDWCAWGQVYRPEWLAMGKPTLHAFGYGRTILAGKLGIMPNTYTNRWIALTEDHGVVDFIATDESCDHEDSDDPEHEECCVTYVTSEHLKAAWTEALS